MESPIKKDFRIILAIILLFAGNIALTNAQTITADVSSACELDPVVLKANGFSTNATALDWMSSIDNGSTWSIERTTAGNTGTFVADMPATGVMYKAVAQGTAEASTPISVSLSEECAAICHTTSTGDYFSGTDFDPEAGVTTSTPTIPDQVVDYFSENDITLVSKSSSYNVTTDLISEFGTYAPSLDENGSSNYYYLYTENIGSSQPFEYQFKCSTYAGKYYRYTMRFYLLKQNAYCGGSAQIKLETGHGNQTTDRATIDIYDDATGTLMNTLDITQTFGSTNLGLGGAEYANKLLRVEITYYGYFPDDRYDPNNGTYNGLQYFTLKPLFQQFDGCFALAIDYISAEIESVCMSRGAVCVGESAIVNAAGFPKDAIYKWEVKNSDGSWSVLKIDGFNMEGSGYSNISIPVTAVGKVDYRVSDANNSTVIIPFQVTGKDCDPVQPTDILGTSAICVPITKEEFSVTPVDANPLVRYSWELTTSSGAVLSDKNLSFTGGSINPEGRGDKIYVTLNANAEEGSYTLKVQPIITRTMSDGSQYDELAGAAISKNFTVYKTPNVSLILSGYADGISEGDKTLCPSDKNQRIVAVANIKPLSYPNYIYEWTNATEIANTDSAVVNLPTAASCDGSMTSLDISVKVSIKDVGCPVTVSNKYNLEDIVDPTVDCSSLTSAQLTYILTATQKDTIVDLPIPDFTAGCDSNPTLDINVAISGKDGSSSVKSFSFEKKELATTNKKVTIPAGTATVTYTVTDGCGKTASCTATITVTDNTEPDIDCSEIPSYTTYLTNQNEDNCFAVPNYSTELPTITAPILTDKNGVDGSIVGVYEGRIENPASTPTTNSTAFDKSVDLNAQYEIGITYILWSFTDNSGNVAKCIQTVNVIDDRQPTIICKTSDLGNLSTQEDECALSFNVLLSRLTTDQIPSAEDVCSGVGSIEATMYYKLTTSTDTIKIEKGEYDKLIFYKNMSYDLFWRFYKKNGEGVYIECAQTFKVVDNQVPDFDCTTLKSIRVLVNTTGTGKNTEYKDYASGTGTSKNMTYTLSSYFDDKTLSIPSTATDNCDGEVTVDVLITNADLTTTTIKTINEFKNHKFQIGSSIITFTFTDDAGNSTSCNQDVYVSGQNTPIPNCDSFKDTTIYVNDNCVATLKDISLNKIPTAEVTYDREVKQYEYKSSLCGSYDFSSYNWDAPEFILRNNSSGPVTVSIYPESVKLILANGSTSICDNAYGSDDAVGTKILHHRCWADPYKNGANSSNDNVCKIDIFETEKLKLTNFSTIPACVTSELQVGTNTLVWYFSNTEGVKDSCTTVITVKDTISPKVNCKEWASTETYYADNSCKVPASEIAFSKPTAADLEATDNCTGINDFTITWNRKWDNYSISSDAIFTDAFPIGTTTIDWIVSDASGNSSTCKQTIIVKDTLGPIFDCSLLTDINVEANGNCEATGDAVQAAGLVIPTTTQDDPCSATGGKIAATGSRNDGNDVFTDAYPLDTTIITWTFTDGAGNTTICTQNVIVTDNTTPIFADCKALTDVVINLDPEECSASLSDVTTALGSHSATDNCSGSIDGVPMLLMPDGTLKTLPASFKKDTTYVIVWVFKDAADNKTECNQNLVIKDVTPPDPSGVCPNPTKNVAATSSCSVSYSDLELPSITMDDHCDGILYPTVVAKVTLYDGSVVTYKDNQLKDAEYPIGVHTIYWIFTDKAGLKDTCEMKLTVSDHIPPEIEDCDVAKDITVTVSEDKCVIDPEDLKPLMTYPKAYDECDDEAGGIGRNFLDPVVERWFEGSLVVDEDGKPIVWDSQDFPKGTTTLKWIFKDIAGNEVSCEKKVTVEDHTAPYFDCSTLNPDTIRPVALDNRCDVLFDEITFNDYYAEDKCTSSLIKGILSLNGSSALPSDYTMEIGTLYSLLWVFTDDDGNSKTCPQYILPSHSMAINFDCSTLQTVEKLAVDDECYISSADLALPVPVTRDTCTKEQILATGSRSDGLSLDDDYPTGSTIVYWTFVSPYNKDSVKVCEQEVNVLGNKKFDIDCETLLSIARDTISDCGTSNIGADIKTPVVDDPCANPDSAYSKREGVGTRSDLLALTDPYPLGITTINWVFTDFTGSVKDSCTQTVVVKTDMEIEFNCDSLSRDTIKVDVKTGECSVTADKVNLHYPKAVNPCTGDSIEGVPTRDRGKTINDNFGTGVTIITWTFTDTTGILTDSVATCYQVVQVGDVNKMPVDCGNMPDTLVKLPLNDCEIEFKELNFVIPPVYDLCTGAHIDSIVSRTSGKGLSEPFTVGSDTINWFYSFDNEDFTCKQVITVKDSMAPSFDCSNLDTIRLASKPGLCYTDLDSVLAELPNPLPTAWDSCSNTNITGTYSLPGGSALPAKFNVGDTVIIEWTFIDSAINLVPKYCEQPVIVTGDQAPIINCDSILADTIKVEGCDTTLDATRIETPIALDACTNDSIYGIGTRSDGKAIYGVYPLGTTTIKWDFISDYSSETATCNQNIVVLTKQELEFDCETFKGDTIKKKVEEGLCRALVDVKTPFALHPCPDQVENDTIWGVPNRSDNLALTDSFNTGITLIKWIFTDRSGTMADSIKECTQVIQVGDVNQMPVDCKNIPDTIIILRPNDCEISWSEINFNAKEVKDLCSDSIITPTFDRSSGALMEEAFNVGIDTVRWHYQFGGQVITCHQAINVKDSMAPNFDCSQLDTIRMNSIAGKCFTTLDSLKLALGNPEAIDSCTNTIIPGVPTKLDGSSLPSEIAVGDTLIVKWTFFNDTINSVAKECEQIVLVTGDGSPIFDCSDIKDTILYLQLSDQCELPAGTLILNIPVAKDSCTNTDVPGTATRMDGEALTAIYPKDTTEIEWSFVSPYSSAIKTCSQNVIVKDTFPPVLSCESLVDTIKVRITTESTSDTAVTAAEAKEKGLVEPTVNDPCDGLITAVGERSDGKMMDENYPLGITDITWSYTDKSGNVDTCHQVVLVEDWITDTLFCPSDLEGEVFSCIDEIPEPYATFEEFKAAGGSFSNESKIKDGSFSFTNTILGDSCNMQFIRTYEVVDVRNNKITCSQTVDVKDDIAPTLDNRPDSIILSCTDVIPDAEEVKATDNCDPNPTVKLVETNTREISPDSCGYFNYDIYREWTVTDRCGNSNSYTQVIEVRDTLAPTVNLPENWRDTVLSTNLKNCEFGVPDFIVEVQDFVSDNCAEVANLKLVQDPKAGSVIEESQWVKIFIYDLCGNILELKKYVVVPTSKSIVTLTGYDTTACASDLNPLSLWSQQIRFAEGYVTVEKEDGSFKTFGSTFKYDCYLDTISEATLVYSDNPNTYYNNFLTGNTNADRETRNKLTNLTRRTQSSVYYFVAMDTLTLCSDTAFANIIINERPRIAMTSDVEKVCEYNSKTSYELNAHVICIDSMGSILTGTGWLKDSIAYDGDSLFMSDDKKALYCYAENKCGITTSYDSYITFCDESKTYEDSLDFVDGDLDKFQLLREDKLTTRDSILLEMHERYQSGNIVLSSDPNNPSRVWKGETIKLYLNTDYDFEQSNWYEVIGKYDRLNGNGDGHNDFVFEDTEDEEDKIFYTSIGASDYVTLTPEDTTYYYVTITDFVCPSATSNLLRMDVLTKLPTAFTPFTKDGYNDVFMDKHPIEVFDRYGQKVFMGNDGWDGTSRGSLVDPGVYFYQVEMLDGSIRKGTIEVVKLD